MVAFVRLAAAGGDWVVGGDDLTGRVGAKIRRKLRRYWFSVTKSK